MLNSILGHNVNLQRNEFLSGDWNPLCWEMRCDVDG